MNPPRRRSSDMHCVILSVSSDIGLALADFWLSQGYAVSGTYRNLSDEVERLRTKGLHALELDLRDEQATREVAREFSTRPWDRLVLAAGSQEPVGLFELVDPLSWGRSIEINFVRQFQFLSSMLPFRSSSCQELMPRVLAFAGGGTNRATSHYSAYTIGKIASIKMIELLAQEITDVCFAILGPGWVNTKIHKATLNAGEAAGANYGTTREHFSAGDFYPMSSVVNAVEWLMSANPVAISGRNFSAVHDPWGEQYLVDALLDDPDLFKMRRFGNDRFPCR